MYVPKPNRVQMNWTMHGPPWIPRSGGLRDWEPPQSEKSRRSGERLYRMLVPVLKRNENFDLVLKRI